MPAEEARPIYASGGCEIDLARRELRLQGEAVPIGGRAFEIIEVLARSAGQLVTKDELMDRVWSGVTVNDNTLQVHIAAVRKALGSYRGMLKTQSGRGYRLLGDWAVRDHRPTRASVIPFPQSEGAIALLPSQPAAEAPASNLPVLVTDLVGRSAALPLIRELLSAYRVVTLTGPGGIGKTTLALHAAQEVRADFDDGSWLVELASLSNPDLVPPAVAAVLGLSISDVISSESIARAIGATRLLLLLDNFEHVIDAAAELVETLVRRCPGVTVLATSRETLRIEGEYVYRVPPLDLPASTVEKLDDLLGHSSIELFIARMQAQDSTFTPNAATLTMVAEICRHLDGIPLAIEFAAARAAALGLPQVVAMLDDRFRLLTGGRRTALPRHQTLRATLDWSYELLAEPERVTLRALAIFAGSFSLRAAQAVVSSVEFPALVVVDCLSTLAARSLLSTEAGRSIARYRLLDTTRAYALEKLIESGTRELIARRHAEYHRNLFERAETEWEVRPTAEWLTDYAWRIDDVRAALDWAFSLDGDASIGVALTGGAIPLWMHLSTMDECRSRVEQALGALGVEPDRDITRRMKLCAALATSLNFTRGQVAETVDSWSNSLAAAEELDHTEHRLQALYGLWTGYAARGDVGAAMDIARRFHRLAIERSLTTDVLMGDRMLGSIFHFSGEQAAARHHLVNMLNGYVPPVHGTATMRHQFDQRIVARALLARVCWMQGLPDQATSFAATAVEDALATDHEIAVCYSLVEGACPVALFTRDFELAKRLVSQLLDRSTRYGLRTWQVLGRCFEAELLIRCGETSIGLSRLLTVIEEVNEQRLLLRLPALLGVLAEVYALTGRALEAADAIERAIGVSKRTGVRWCLPELLRIKGEVLLQDADGSGRTRAEEAFNQALELGRHQGALSWQLRAASSLARLWIQERRSGEARELVRTIYEGFTEGFRTRDLLEARALIV
jgi:predicted ATPase/DNA-binding winged helix-turn-helix (wHTH) protein